MGPWAPASYTRASPSGGGHLEQWPILKAPAERRVVAEHPGGTQCSDTLRVPTAPESKLPRRLLTSAWSCWPGGGILADVTVQADHVALQLRWN